MPTEEIIPAEEYCRLVKEQGLCYPLPDADEDEDDTDSDDEVGAFVYRDYLINAAKKGSESKSAAARGGALSAEEEDKPQFASFHYNAGSEHLAGRMSASSKKDFAPLVERRSWKASQNEDRARGSVPPVHGAKRGDCVCLAMPSNEDSDNEELGAMIYKWRCTAKQVQTSSAAGQVSTSEPWKLQSLGAAAMVAGSASAPSNENKRKAPSANKAYCSVGDCINRAQKGGKCVKHGGKRMKRPCEAEGCTNVALRGGVCHRHGATRKLCSREGCANFSQKGGLCVTHGGGQPRKKCSHEGCANNVQKGGVCIRHGAQVKRCSHEGCTNQQVKGGKCNRHLCENACEVMESAHRA